MPWCTDVENGDLSQLLGACPRLENFAHVRWHAQSSRRETKGSLFLKHLHLVPSLAEGICDTEAGEPCIVNKA